MKKFTKHWPALVIFLMVASFAFPYWAQGKVPFPADHLVDAFVPWQYYFAHPVKNNAMPDVVTQMYPFKHLVINYLKAGFWPLWNPNNFSGGPLLANYQSAVFHPSNWLFFLLPEIEAWSLMILLQPLLAGIFTYLFCRELNIGKPASLLGAFSFMFCGFMTVWMAYGTLSWAILWLPLVLFGVENYFQKQTFFSLPLVSLGLGASFFSGHFQTSLYVFFGTIGYLIYKILVTKNTKFFLLTLGFSCLGVFLAFGQILPTLELYRQSIRGSYHGVSEVIPWQYLPTLLSPDFYGNPVTRNDWFGHYAEWSGFCGVIPMVLAVMALGKRKNKTVWFFGLLAVFSFLISRPTPLINLIENLKIPVFSSSAAARVNGLFSFSVAVLATFGLEALLQDLKKARFKKALAVAALFLVLVGVVWGYLLFVRPFETEKLMVAQRNLILPTGLIAAFTGLLTGLVMVKNLIKKKSLFISGVLIFTVSVLGLTAFDVWRFAYKWMPFDSRKNVYPSLPILDYLTSSVGSERVFGYFGMEMQNYFQIPGFNGYDPLYLRRYGELLTSAADGKIKPPSTRGVGLGQRERYTVNLLNLLGGKYILHAIPDDRHVWAFNFWEYPGQFEKKYQDETYEVYENLKAFPRAFVVYDYQVVKDPQGIVDQIYTLGEDLRETVILEEPPRQEVVSGGRGSVVVVNFLPNRVALSVQTDSPGLLFMSENYYPGWRALVDGRETKIYRADYTFRAIEVPAGEHEVVFLYQPVSFKAGLTISLVSLTTLLSWGFVRFKLARRKKG